MENNHIKFLIERYLAEHKVTFNQFRRMCGVSRYIINKMLKGNINVSTIYVLRIIRVLGVSSDEFLKQFLNP